MFRTVPLSIIRSLALYTQQLVYVIQVMLTVCQRDQDGTGGSGWNWFHGIRMELVPRDHDGTGSILIPLFQS